MAVLTTAAADTALAADKPPSIPSRPVPSPAPTASRSPSPRVAPIKAPGPTTGQAVGKESRVAAEYWTAARMAAAKPLGYKPLGRRAKASSGLAAGAPPGTPASEHFSGTPVVGTFFAHGPTGTDWYCTGSVIDSSTRNIVLTAGHCGLGLNGGNYIFVPKFTMGAGPDQQPFGIFKVQHLFMDARYGPSQTSLPVSDLDTAFARVAPNQFGKQLQDAVHGALTFTQPSGYINTVQIIGYPANSHGNNTGYAVQCSKQVVTSQLAGYRQMQMTCGGYFGGTSGSPWIVDWNPTMLTGKVIGNLGGKGGGGSNDWTSYAPLFGQNAADLLNDAIANQDPPSNPPPYIGLSQANKFPEGAATWQHAKLLASGDYTGNHHSDLIVVWTDGEVTLYPGDGQGGFLAEKQLAPPQSIWTHAETITGGDFAGGPLYDLMVRWSDGEVTLYPDVSTAGLGSEVQMAPPGSQWKDAMQISAGQFHNGGYVTDLVVRWVDGELSLYTYVGAGTFGTEHQLLAPNSTWRDATLVTGANLAGQPNWDIFVRWVDGELDTYVATSAAGLGAEYRMRDANSLWTHDLVMTAGNYIGDSYNDDLIVRWSDGETTLYAGSGPSYLGKENTLVYPGT
ncbi:trypsin-like serine protease (plasmid) [Streptomyces sp. NBC_01384]|uniref:trypsin-like serine peptidase n=1 Tax=Streptomyces sp. NBC_01384 TaxID=2903847 RepID=UPI00324DB0C2